MCDERERLIGYVYDECDPQERSQISRHLDECDVCQVEIKGLRRVREDLLAWDVPRHEPVWTAFAPPRDTPWWREVPAWAMAAAATLTLAAGSAGGMLTTAVASAAPADAAPPVTVVQPGPADAQVEVLAEQVEILRAALADQRTRTDAMTSAVASVAGSNSDAIYSELLLAVRDMNDTARNNNDKLLKLKRDLIEVSASLTMLSDQGRK